MSKRKVAILGGGMGGLSTAWRLVHAPGGQDRFDITVYQRDGWLGGKGASSRSVDPDTALRIEEHGIHILMGWYDEVTGLLRGAYSELAADPPDPVHGKVLAWDKVFTPYSFATMSEPPASGKPDWTFWTVHFPDRPGVPGVGTGARALPDLLLELGRTVAVLRHALQGAMDAMPDAATLFGVLDTLDAFAGGAIDALVGTAADDLTVLDNVTNHPLAEIVADAVLSFLHTVGPAIAIAFGLVPHLPNASESDLHRTVRRAWIGVWLAGTTLAGLLRAHVKTREDLDALDAQDWKDWLRSVCNVHMLPDTWQWESPPVQILYDLTFSRSFGAGSASYAALMFGLAYRGSFMQKMNGGMGEIVFAPLFLALQKRGVKFEFYHEVADLHLDATLEVVESVDLRVRTLPPTWSPLSKVLRDDGAEVPYWPKDTTGIAAQTPIARTLTRGADFDDVVLAISVGALPAITSELCAANSRFDTMVHALKTTSTLAGQVWMNPDPKALGRPPEHGMVADFTRPFNSCVDMGHTLPAEAWGTGSKPKTVYYLCELADDPPAAPDPKVALTNFLSASEVQVLWPNYTHDVLFDRSGGVGAARIDKQYWRLNNDTSDRYVLVAANTTQHRLRADQSGFANLVLAGDWVRTNINAGCVEAAALGGHAAADALLSPTHRYVDLTTDWVRPSPFRLNGAALHLFPFKANLASLTALCDKMFNTPSDGAVKVAPVAGVVFVTFSTISEARSVPEAADGFLSEKEFGIFIPVTIEHGGSKKFGSFVPVLFVDDDAAVIAGREIFGCLKFPGELSIDPAHMTFSADALRLQAAAPTHQATIGRVATLTGVGWTSSPTGADILRATATFAASLAVGFPALASLLSTFGGVDAVRTVFLKQARDAMQPELASYQEILTTVVKAKNFVGASAHVGTFTFAPAQNFRPAYMTELGLMATNTTSIGLTLEFDYDLEAEASLWSTG